MKKLVEFHVFPLCATALIACLVLGVDCQQSYTDTILDINNITKANDKAFYNFSTLIIRDVDLQSNNFTVNGSLIRNYENGADRRIFIELEF